MKKLHTLLLALVAAITAAAQQPTGFSYQAVLRNSSGQVLANQNVTLRLSITSSDGSTTYYAERHAVNTGPYGLVGLTVGEGTPLSGSLGEVPWGSNETRLKVELSTDGGSTFSSLGSQRIQPVPMAVYADSANLRFTRNLVVVGNDPANPDDPIFEVKNSKGEVLFGVYQEGVRVNIPDSAITKGAKGGFAVGGLTNQTKEGPVEYLRITPDSARVYVKQSPGTKGAKGGFAVGGLTNQTKAVIAQDLLFVNTDSARFYINENPGKGAKGGFAVGGLTNGKTSAQLIQLTKENYLIGYEAGKSITTGLFNSILGYQAGSALTTGQWNTFLGFQSGFSTSIGEKNAFFGYMSGFLNTEGSSNLFLGYKSGYSNVSGNYNTFLGYMAGFNNTIGINNSFLGSFAGQNNSNGSYNVFVGDSTGYANTSGEGNSFLGTKAGLSNTTGYKNTFVGNYTGRSNVDGYANVFIGNSSGFSNTSAGGNVFIGNETGFLSGGWNNVYIGTQTGYNNLDGEGNVFIGYQTGYNNLHGTRNIFIGNRAGMNQQGSNRLIIDNDGGDSTSAIIWGNLIDKHLRFNASVGIGTNPDWHNLSVFNKFGRGTINLKGIGDSYDFSTIYLESEQAAGNRAYVFSHQIENSFGLYYYDGANFNVRMRIDSLGKLSLGNYSATEMLDVNGNARFRSIASDAYFGPINVKSDGTLTTATSDIRLKENIKTLENCLHKVLSLRGVSFTWKSEPEMGQRIGMVAQEVELVLPELVFINKIDGYKGINYAEMSALLVEAIKEQQQEIQRLEEKVKEFESIKAELESLKSLLQAK